MTENEKEKKSQSDKNFEKAALTIAVLMGLTPKSYEELAWNPTSLRLVTAKIHSQPELLKAVEKEEPLPADELEMEMKAVKAGKYMKVRTAGGEKVCDKCKPWQGKIICLDGSDSRYPSLDDYTASGAFHVNCRCALQELDVDEIPLKEPNPRRPQRKAIRPDIYNRGCSPKNTTVVFSSALPIHNS